MSENIPGWFPGWLDVQIALYLALRDNPLRDALVQGIPGGRQVMFTATAEEARWERLGSISPRS